MRTAMVVTLLGVGLSGCVGITKCISSDLVLDQFNAAGSAGDAGSPAFATCTRLATAIAEDSLADVYDTPHALDALSVDGGAQALAEATRCVAQRQGAQTTDRACFACLFGVPAADAGVACAHSLTFPTAPTTTDDAAWKVERDVERVQHGLQRMVRAMAQTCTVLTGPGTAEESPLERAWARATQNLMTYQRDRPLSVHPNNRPVSAWVLSGGAANGAFSAGAVWWLLHLHQQCEACRGDQVDLLSAASTGTLIAALTKNYFRAGASADDRQLALDDLVHGYTCSSNADLYCKQKVSLFDLLFNDAAPKRGLIDFNGVRSLLTAKIGTLDEAIRRAPEQFASTVDYQSGDVFHFSSAQIESKDAWAQALEASIVEPLAAEPVSAIGGRKGTWIDGGVRSGLPLMTPLRRGADRAVVFVNSPFESVPKPRMKNAGEIIFRSIDLFSFQPLLGELAQAEQEKVLKRQGEKERCLDRLGFDTASDAAAIERRCSGERGPRLLTAVRVRPSGAPVTQPGTPVLDRLASPYLGTWLFVPTELKNSWQASLRVAPGKSGEVEWKDIGSAGYTFDPNAMWNLFVVGALVANEHCEEINATLGWHLPCPGLESPVHEALKGVRAAFEANKCGQKSLEIPACRQ